MERWNEKRTRGSQCHANIVKTDIQGDHGIGHVLDQRNSEKKKKEKRRKKKKKGKMSSDKKKEWTNVHLFTINTESSNSYIKRIRFINR